MSRPALQASLLTLALLAAAIPARAQTMPNIIGPNGPLGSTGVTFRRQPNSHFILPTEVNGAQLLMMFDTGASTVALRHEDAVKAGIDMAGLDYSQRISTANGVAFSAPILLSSISVGGITRRNVQAMVAKPGALSVSLLGQTFTQRLRGFRAEDNRLTLLDR